MASTNKTAGLKLNQYISTDKPTMADYNADMAKIDNLTNQNLLINGNFQVWQRGTSFSVGSSAWVYTADRWRVKATSGTVTITKDSTGIKTSGACTLQYVLSAEDLAMLTGKTVTLTYLKNGVVQTASTFTVSSKTVVSLTLATNNVINWVKLELGSLSTGRVINTYTKELQDCLAYYVPKQDNRITATIYTDNAGCCDVFIPYPVKMVKTPTIVFYDGVSALGKISLYTQALGYKDGQTVTQYFTSAYGLSPRVIGVIAINTVGFLIVYYTADAEDYT